MGLNAGSCNAAGNFGLPNCTFTPAQIKFYLLFPKNTIIAASNFLTPAAFTTYMQGVIWNNLPSQRVRVIPQLSDVTDKSKDVVTVEHDNRRIKVVDTPYVFDAQLWQGSNGATKFIHTQLYKLIDSQQAIFDIVFVDINGAFWFTSLNTTNFGDVSVLNLTSIIVPKWKMMDYKDANMYPFEISLGTPAQLNGNDVYFQPSQGMDYWYNISLVDVVMCGPAHSANITSPNTTSIIYVNGWVGGGQNTPGSQSLGASYGTGLDTASYWAVNDMAGGGAIVPTSVTYDAVNDQYLLHSSAAFTSGHTYLVGLAVPSVVTAAGIYAVTDGTVANPGNKVQCVIP